MSYARLDLSVAAPPQTLDEALAVAVEHFAFCPDNIGRGTRASASTRRKLSWISSRRGRLVVLLLTHPSGRGRTPSSHPGQASVVRV
ncbi:DUF4253 domain-containing protein [Streptomyces sp. 900105245]